VSGGPKGSPNRGTAGQSADNLQADLPGSPLLRILTPDATPEQIAAIVAVLAAIGGSGESPTDASLSARASTWAHPARQVRHPHRHGPDGWRLSGLPR